MKKSKKILGPLFLLSVTGVLVACGEDEKNEVEVSVSENEHHEHTNVKEGNVSEITGEETKKEDSISHQEQTERTLVTEGELSELVLEDFPNYLNNAVFSEHALEGKQVTTILKNVDENDFETNNALTLGYSREYETDEQLIKQFESFYGGLGVSYKDGIFKDTVNDLEKEVSIEAAQKLFSELEGDINNFVSYGSKLQTAFNQTDFKLYDEGEGKFVIEGEGTNAKKYIDSDLDENFNYIVRVVYGFGHDFSVVESTEASVFDSNGKLIYSLTHTFKDYEEKIMR